MSKLTSQWFTTNVSATSAIRLQAAEDNNARAICPGEPDNEAVQAIQLSLAQFYLMPKSIKPDGTADGKFGDETFRATWGYQGQRRLKQDGKVGPKTLAALDHDMQDKRPPKIVPRGGGAPGGAEDPKTLAESSKGLAEQRVNTAIRELLWYRLSGVGEREPHRLEVMLAALNAHFGFDRKASAATTDDSLLDIVSSNFSKVQAALQQSASVFRAVTQAEYDVERPGKSLVPAYASFNLRVTFTPMFKRWDGTGSGYGDQTRAAMLIHECVHYVDSNAPDHAYEWQPTYDTLKAEDAVHNPSSYATFAAHLDRGYDRPRPGAGNPWL